METKRVLGRILGHLLKEGLLERVPLSRSICGLFQDLISFCSSKQHKGASQVRIVALGGSGAEAPESLWGRETRR